MSEEPSLPPPSLDETGSTASSSSSSFVPIEPSVQDAIQIINERKEFNANILEYINTTAPGSVSKVGQSPSVGDNYHIISVFGLQSTGKSTLLNRLFNTNFDVMDETNRQQTTKGIWMAYSPHVLTTQSSEKQMGRQLKETVLVMDVEGTDGRERGEDQDFERKAALFALATSEILIINVWEQQIGLYQGANMGLLKTVFEVNLTLFGRAKLDQSANLNHKVLLLLVIRDHIGNTPKESLAQTVKESLFTIWDLLSKPVELAHLAFYEFFDLAFHTLSHKVLQADLFAQDIQKLGDKLIDSHHPEYLFKPQYHHSIPIDGWTMYAEQCWQQIDSNKDLDLPTQQVLVAKFKCDEISADVFEEFYAKYDQRVLIPLKSVTDSVDFEQVGLYMVDLLNDSLEDYDQAASRYNNSIYQQKRLLLVKKMIDTLKEVLDVYINILTDEVVQDFKSSLKAGKSGGKRFVDLVKEMTSKSIDDFEAKAEFLSLSNQIDYTRQEEVLTNKLNDITSQQQVLELNSIVSKSVKRLAAELTKYVTLELSEPKDNSWDKILNKFESLLTETQKRYLTTENMYDFGLGTSAQLNQFVHDQIRFKSWSKFHEIIRQYISKDNFLNILKERFEDKFRYDENGLPRLYQNVHELEVNFKTAKEFALQIVPFVTIARLSDDSEILPPYDIFNRALQRKYQLVTDTNVKESLHETSDSDSEAEDESRAESFAIIINETDKASVLAKFKRETDAVFVETNRSIVQHITQIPYYIYLIILALGWNEFMAVIRNPLFFLLLLVGGAGVYILYTLNLLRPAVLVVQKMIDESIAVGKTKLREWVIDEHDFHATALGKITGVSAKNDDTKAGVELEDITPAKSE